MRTTALLTLLVLPFLRPARAREDILYTSSVSYCEPPQSLLVQQFDFAYFSANRSVSFNISAQSVSTDVSLGANVLVNVYGSNPFNFTLDLCNVLSGLLCPLPVYNFQGADSLSLPDSLGIADIIPGIAFDIPDLEAYAQLSLYDMDTDEVKACVQATLSNGWSTRQRGVEWATRAFALFALVLAVYASTNPHSLVPFRFIDLIHLFQTIAFSGLLSINYPFLYRSFTFNFSWAIGLFPPSFPSSMQNSIDNMRAMTGGQMPNSTSDSAVGLVNRKLSPYNTPLSFNSVSNLLAPAAPPRFTSGLSRFTQLVAEVQTELFNVFIPTAGPVEIINEDNTLQDGIPIYTNSVNIGAANAFMTVFLTSLIVIAIVAGLLALGYLVFRLAARHAKAQRIRDWMSAYPPFARGWALRTVLVLMMPILVFTFYQWTINDSWLAVLLSVISLLGIAVGVLYPSFLLFRQARTAPSDLYSSPQTSSANGPLHAAYRTPRWFFFTITLLAMVVRSLVIGFGQNNGRVQVALLVTVEFIVLLALIVLRPHPTRGADALAIYLAITRLVCVGLFIAFLESLSVAAIPRVVIGVVAMVIYSVAVVVLFFNLMWHLVSMVFRRGKGGREDDVSSDLSIVEKAEGAPIARRHSSSAPATPVRTSVDSRPQHHGDIH